MGNDSKLLVFRYHEKYWAIAVEYLAKARQAASQHDALVKAGATTFEEINALLSYSQEIERLSLIAIVFAALAAEAFINDYAIRQTSKSFFSKHLDRLDPVSKWIIVPRLVTGKQIDTGSRGADLYRQLATLRNRLVHWKTVVKPDSEVAEADWIGEDQAELALSAVLEIARELQSIDPNVDLEWLERL